MRKGRKAFSDDDDERKETELEKYSRRITSTFTRFIEDARGLEQVQNARHEFNYV
jgi:hypothetical protein